MDAVERHIVYFMTGFVAVVSIVLLSVFLYMFILAPMFVFGWHYVFVMPAIMAAMYFIGRNILNKVR